MAKKSEEFNFEAAIAELNQLVEKMEKGGLSLEESLANFERGISLTKDCQKVLKDAEQKVQILVKKQQQTLLEDFDQDQLDS